MSGSPDRSPADRDRHPAREAPGPSPVGPEPSGPAALGLALDGLGNRALAALLRSGRLRRMARASRPGDPCEREADRAAEAVVSGGPEVEVARSPAAEVQRMPAGGEGLAGPSGPAPGGRDAGDWMPLAGGRPLDEGTRGLMESRFGEDFGGVTVHDDDRAAEAADALGARAFTVGRQVVFGEGEYAPETTEGRRLLAHELAHVVQQRQEAGSLGGEAATEADARDAARAAAVGGRPDVRERAAIGSVQKQGRPAREVADLEELKRLDALAGVSTLSRSDEARREEIREELGRRDESRREGGSDEPFIGPPRPSAADRPPAATPTASKGPPRFLVVVDGNRLTARLNGEVVAAGWIKEGAGVAVEENYGQSPSHYYVTLWIDGENGVEHDAGAIAEFRKVSDEVNFHIRRTRRSLQERPFPLESPAPAPPPRPAPRKTPPRIIVPPESPGRSPEAPFLESDPEPPRADFGAGVLELRRRMAVGEPGVEGLAAGLTIPELRSLRIDERIRLIRLIADGWFVWDDEERTINDLIDTTPEPDAARLLAELQGAGSALLERLEGVIDGEEYIQFHLALRRLHQRSLGPAELSARADDARTRGLAWVDPGAIDFFQHGMISYKITRNGDGTIHVRRFYSTPVPFGSMEVAPLDLEPFQMVAVYFPLGEEALGGEKGAVAYMPAENLLLLENKQFKQQVELAMNVGMVAGGGAGIIRATGRLALAIATAELTVGAANIVIGNYKAEIGRTPAGANFLRAWEVVNLLFAAYGAGRALASAPGAIVKLRDSYKAFLAARGSLDPALVREVEREMARLLARTDDVEKALAEQRAADVAGGRPPGPTLKAELDELDYSQMPLVETTPAPKPSEIAALIDEALGKSEVLGKWVRPRQAAGHSAAGRVRVVPDQDYVKWRAANLAGLKNPATGRVFTPEEAIRYAQKSLGSTDKAGQITFPTRKFEPGNAVHEGLHQLQSAEFRRLPNAISEGATEYLTMIAAREQGIARDWMKYQEFRLVNFDMVRIAGFDRFAEAYFTGNLAPVKATFDALKPGLWEEWLKLCRQGQFDRARSLLQAY